MGNNSIRDGLIFLSGIACGTLLGYVTVKKHVEERCQEDIEDARAYYKSRYESHQNYIDVEECVEVEEKAKDETPKASSEDNTVKTKSEKEKDIQSANVDYTAPSSAKKKSTKKIREITKDDYFAEEDDGYEKSQVLYIPDDRVFEETMSGKIWDDNSIFGNANVSRFLSKKTVMYIRNDNIKTDFELVYPDDDEEE